MVSEPGRNHYFSYKVVVVLILVLVEDGLGAFQAWWNGDSPFVLILVLVEDGLGVTWYRGFKLKYFVLILVLVEDGLGVFPCIFYIFFCFLS